MIDKQPVTLRDLARQVGRYPEEAFAFVRAGLAHAAEQVHGPESPAHRILHEYIHAEDLDWNDLVVKYYTGELPDPVVEAIDAAGGVEKLNRHVGGRELCWGLRDFALSRWGLLARTVLDSWNIRSTQDFGAIVFAFIDADLMQKQSDDSEHDFEEVYSFEEAFDEPFRSLSSGAINDDNSDLALIDGDDDEDDEEDDE